MIAPSNVHFTIQQLSRNLQGHDMLITVNAIARNLNINIDELSPSLDILYNMNYIRFTDRENEQIMLTFAGKHAPESDPV